MIPLVFTVVAVFAGLSLLVGLGLMFFGVAGEILTGYKERFYRWIELGAVISASAIGVALVTVVGFILVGLFAAILSAGAP
jgi:hypothetical protein